ncbi:proteasome assembly chaperone family protein [Haematomicrobium sanguinis]|uniref:proteasome assembly chaperone family protein n=1 Tax=Haematomicrobium sanguinis TaxID=479106 RepID=UPI00047998A1|nr:PAC2 family protein [Haematomicrobium sanguinis]
MSDSEHVESSANQEATGLVDVHRQQYGPDADPIRVMVIAFEGWNDAGDAATDSLRAIRDQWPHETLDIVESDDFYDFQFTRPSIMFSTDGSRRLRWPRTKYVGVDNPETDVELVIVTSVEPSYHWRSFAKDVIARAVEWDIDYLVLVGALLADVPHTRPMPVTKTSENADIRDALGFEKPTYQGPVGIPSVLAEAAEDADIPTVSIWVAVPHYVSQAPSPKAQLAVLGALEEILQVHVNVEDIAEDAHAWERGVNELATEDPEVANYVRQLEEAKDTADLPEASGESIAREFERYLRKRKDP